MATEPTSANTLRKDPQTLDAQRCAGLAGIAAALLFGIGSALWAFDMPSAGAPAARIADFYRHTSGRIVAGASLSLLAIAAYLLFAAALRRVLTQAEGDDLLATTAFGGALLGLAAGLGAETINMVAALRASGGKLSNEFAQALWEIARSLGTIGAGLPLGVFALATAAVALRTGRPLPRWLAIATAIIGICLLTPFSYYLGQMTGGSLVVTALMIGVVLLRTPAEEEKDASRRATRRSPRQL